MHPFRLLLPLLGLIAFIPLSHAEEAAPASPATEFPSPDGRFAFRYVAETDEAPQAFELIRQPEGKSLLPVAKQEMDLGASSRFGMKVLWRPDSQAFALTATYWKRGSTLTVFLRQGDTFREVKLPEFDAEISEKQKQGKSYPHVSEMNAQQALRWRKDGALVAQVESIQDGESGSITLLRTVTLSIPAIGGAKILSDEGKLTRE